MNFRNPRRSLIAGLLGAVAALPAASPTRAAEYEIMAASFTVDNQLNASSATYYGTMTTAPAAPAAATQLATPGGLYFDGTRYRVWDVPSGAWVALATGTSAGLLPWSELTGFPPACPAGQFASAVGAALTCSASGTLSGGTAGLIPAWAGASSLGPSHVWDQASPVVTTSMTVQGNAFSVGGSTLVVAGGSVGIGTTNPSNQLHVASNTSAFPRGMTSSQHTNDATSGLLLGRKSRGSATSPTAVANGDYLAGFQPEGYDGSAYQKAGFIGFTVNGAVGAATMPTDIVFYTTPTSGDGTERARITSGGNVGVGTPNPVEKLEVAGNLKVIIDDTGSYPTKNVAKIMTLGVYNLTGADNWALRGVYQYPGGVGLNAAGGDLDLIKSMNGSTVLATKTDGSPLGGVGISTPNPQTRLDVNGDASFGAGAAKSTFTTTGALTLSPNAALSLSSASGFITTQSSVTASAFFGDGSHLAGVPSTGSVVQLQGTTPGTAQTGHLFINGTGTFGSLVAGSGLLNVSGNVNPTVAAQGAWLGWNALNGKGSGQSGETDFINNQGLGNGGFAFLNANNAGVVLSTPMVVLGGGAVGIGTTGPVYKLDVVGTTDAGAFSPVSAAEGNASISINAASILGMGKTATGGNALIAVQSAKDLIFADYSVGYREKMRITTSGNIGVGTPSPATKLHMSSGTLTIDGNAATGLQVYGSTFVVNSSGNVGIGTMTPTGKLSLSDGVNIMEAQMLSSSLANFWGTRTPTDFGLMTNNASRLYIQSGGNVGIGTIAPGSKLEVIGASVVGGWGTGDLLTINTANTPGTSGGLLIQSASAGSAYLRYDRQGGWAGKTYIGNNASTVGNSPTTAITIDGTRGNLVGIGTTSPGQALDVAGGVNVSSGVATGSWVVSGCTNPNDPADVMVPVGDLCVDKYEASVWSSLTGGAEYGTASGNYPCTANGQNCGPGATAIYARSVSGVTPSRFITWFQAAIACANSGKHLLTNAEWQVAAAGTPDPGAGVATPPGCNVNTLGPSTTGADTSCLSSYGVMDAVGSLWEWTADWGQYGQISQASYVAWADSTANVPWPDASYGGDGTWNVAGRSHNNVAMASGLPGAPYRGGHWGSGASGGVFAVYAGVGPSYADASVGLRCGRRR